MAPPFLRLLSGYLSAGLLVACTREPESASTTPIRSARYDHDDAPTSAPRTANQKPAGARAANASGPSNTGGTHNQPDQSPAPPPETADAEILEAAALRPSDGSAFGTRAQAIRCQPALGEAALFFTPSWYAYDDQANPGTPIRGCERGDSDSILEALPRGAGRTSLCAIGWRAVVRSGIPFPYAGMGVETAGNLEGVQAIDIETRSTGAPLSIRAQLHLDDQELLPCGDARKAPYEQRLRCDGSGEWVLQRLPITGFKPTYGNPAPLDLRRVMSLHFQTAPGFEGTLECDFRIAGVH